MEYQKRPTMNRAPTFHTTGYHGLKVPNGEPKMQAVTWRVHKYALDTKA
jgi:hypothetical protein